MPFDDVFEILLQQGINPGFAYRISLCSKTLNNMLVTHNYYWRHVILNKMKISKKYNNCKVVESLKNTKRCRECGGKNGRKVVTTKKNFLWICCKCTEEKNGYNELYTRMQIKKGKDLVTNKNKVIKFLLVAKRGHPHGKYLYWRHEVETYFKTMKQLKKRILPFY